MEPQSIQSIGYGVGLIILGGITAYREWRDRRDRRREAEISMKFGLSDNPTRCLEHTEDIKWIKSKVGENTTLIAVLNTKVDSIMDDVEDIKHGRK